MNTRWRKFPYPVLNNTSDDFNCSFCMNIEIDIANDAYCINTKADLICPEIQKLINISKASFALNVECSSTLYRKTFIFNKSEFKFSIPSNDVNGKVDIYPLIISNVNNDSYFSKFFNPDYSGLAFNIKKGDILGFDNPASFDAFKYSESKRDLPSIFAIRMDENLSTSFNVINGDNKIMIYLSKECYEKYNEISQNPNMQPILVSTFILPALVYVLEDIRNSTDLSLISDKRWFMVIKSKLALLNIDIEDPNSFNDSSIIIAQKLLGDFYKNAIDLVYEHVISED